MRHLPVDGLLTAPVGKDQPGEVAAVTGEHSTSARVRPYAMTRGRTRSRSALLLETLISVPVYEWRVSVALAPECQEIYELCRQVHSIAEISVHLRIPVGVVRVLTSDLADQGRVRVHPPAHDPDQPGQEIFERVLRGLQALPR